MKFREDFTDNYLGFNVGLPLGVTLGMNINGKHDSGKPLRPILTTKELKIKFLLLS